MGKQLLNSTLIVFDFMDSLNSEQIKSKLNQNHLLRSIHVLQGFISQLVSEVSSLGC